ncbi:MAG: hypothetical protein AB7L84_15550 [Acidimicrobiia bacterium]
MASTRPSQARWDPLAAMALGPSPRATVHVKSTLVPAGGVLTAIATDFGPGRLRVLLDLDADRPLATFELDDGGGSLRVPIPADVSSGRHLVTFAADDREVDLLVDVTASSATVGIDPRRVAPGDTVTFVARGFPPGELGHVKLDSEGKPAPFRIGPDGIGEGRFVVPAGTTPGLHHLRFLAPNPSTSTVQEIVVEV